MLSFLREQGPGGAKRDKGMGSASAGNSQSEGHKTRTRLGAPEATSKAGQPAGIYGIDAEGAAESQEQEYLTVATHNKNARRSTVMFAVLFGIGMLCLWFMIKKSTPQTASASTISTEQTQIETAITKLVGIKSEMFDRMDEIVNKFYEFSDVYQVKVDELVKNPFKLEVLLGNLKKKTDTADKEHDIDTEMIRQQQLREQAKILELLSIMQSARGYCCMIDDEILYEGDLIKGFEVRQIGDDFVKLESVSFTAEPQSDRGSLGIQIILRLSK